MKRIKKLFLYVICVGLFFNGTGGLTVCAQEEPQPLILIIIKTQGVPISLDNY